MLLVKAVKTLVLGGCMLPIAFGALGTGILFLGYNLAVSRNPEESENLFNATLMGFAFIETFVFLSFFLGAVVYII
uniref:ATP synthase F0 subunit 9 n=1 Tax=Ichthyophthirius multifiliis TaxID=5932 RepID=G1FLC4_ICHMU|nr:ATP synthase F0 subunit 9 [Ichthyophthirius multifiliis]AEL89266.1 ATP synthase F0 subunit 9 [Ichthyophthirius multifiliis]